MRQSKNSPIEILLSIFVFVLSLSLGFEANALEIQHYLMKGGKLRLVNQGIPLNNDENIIPLSNCFGEGKRCKAVMLQGGLPLTRSSFPYADKSICAIIAPWDMQTLRMEESYKILESPSPEGVTAINAITDERNRRRFRTRVALESDQTHKKVFIDCYSPHDPQDPRQPTKSDFDSAFNENIEHIWDASWDKQMRLLSPQGGQPEAPPASLHEAT